MVHVGLEKRALRGYRPGCSKQFPKAFSAITTNAEDGYPIYCRRNNARIVNVGGHNWIKGGL